MATLLMLTFGLYRHLITSFLINRYRQTVIVYKSSVLNIVKRNILFPNVYIQDVGNTTNWVTIRQTA